jgi:hypothetical protein
MQALAAGNDRTQVTLSSLVKLDWDRMYVFGAYSWPDQTSAALGFKWLEGARSASTIQDKYQLIVLTKGRNVVLWADFDRTAGAFDVDGLPLSRAEAVFRKANTAWGTVFVPVGRMPTPIFFRSGPNAVSPEASKAQADALKQAAESELREFERQRASGFPRAEGADARSREPSRAR